MSDGSSKLVVIDEEANHQVMHCRRFRKASGASHQTLDPGIVNLTVFHRC